MRRAAVVIAALITALWAPAAGAYVRTVTSMGVPMFWNRTVLELTAYAGDPPAPLTAQDVMIAVKGAADSWSRDRLPCTSLELRVVASSQASAPVAMDGVSRMTFRRSNWCKEPRTEGDTCYDPFALAVTSVFARKNDGEIVDADIEVNAVTFTWSDLVRKPEENVVLQDLQNAITHELGHFIGLDHTCFLAAPRAGSADDRGHEIPSCGQATDDIRATTMFAAVIPGDLDRRSLSEDDRRAVCEIYRPIDLLVEATMPTGCAVGGRPGAPGRWLAAVLVLLAATAISVRRRRTGRPATGFRPSTDPAPRR
jgi:MYXO-CTERM domain-containing protein